MTNSFSTRIANRVSWPSEKVLIAFAAVFWAGTFYYSVTQQMPRGQFGVAFLGAAILILVLRELETALSEGDWVDLLLLGIISVGTIASTVYFFTQYRVLNMVRVGYSTNLDYVMTVPIVAIILYLIYREYGKLFTGVILFAIFYGMFGYIFPGVFQHQGLESLRLLSALGTNLSGVYGRLTRLVAGWVALFVLYGGLLQGYGAFDLIMRGAFKAADFIESGVAQISVLASMLVGSINGSVVTNITITGSITIPLMEESGIRPRTAAAIETVASNGGQLIPPVMGAAAFLMAGIIGVPYAQILIAGVVPALIFYISLVVAVHFAAVDEINDFDLEEKREGYFDEKWSRTKIGLESARFLLPVIVLVYTIAVLSFTIPTAGVFTVGTMILTGCLRPILESPSTDGVKRAVSQTLEGAKLGALGVAPIAIIIAGVNAMLDVLNMTGMPIKLSIAIVSLSGGVLLLAIIAGMLVCIILGLGMPTPAAYLVVAILVAPTFVTEFNTPELAAHFFVLYAASLAAITPPIAVGVVVAAGISGANFWRTAKKAIRISLHLFLLPVMFIYHPETVTASPTMATVVSGTFGLLGAVGIIYGLNKPRPWLNREYRWGLRSAYVAAGAVVMVYPGRAVQVGALAVLGILYVFDQRSQASNLLDHAPGA